MSILLDSTYKKYLLPRRLIFIDLDGTIIPSTTGAGRRIAISIATYEQLRQFARQNLQVKTMPNLDEEQCSKWYRSNGGPQGLIKRILLETELEDHVKDCLGFYFNGLFNRRLTRYLQDDLKHDSVPESHFSFLRKLTKASSLILVSYRYQSQFEFLTSLGDLGLLEDGLFGPNNAFAVGEPGTSSDGSKSRFVGGVWRREIRAQRRLTSNTGETFPPFVIGDSIRDIHFAAGIGSLFFGVSDTGEDSHDILIAEIKKQLQTSRARVYSSLADEQLQTKLLAECQAYEDAIKSLGTT